MKQEELSLFGYQCMSFGVGTALLLNFCIRLLHHGGKAQIKFGAYVHVSGSNTKINCIATLWWYTLGVLSLSPFIFYFLGITTRDPVQTTMYHAGLVFGLCFIESTYSHTILGMTSVNAGTTSSHHSNDSSGENQPLL
jgi:hypothetical protein